MKSRNKDSIISKRSKPDSKTRLSLPLKISMIITLVMLVETALFYSRLQPEIPLFYSLADPEQQLAHKPWIFILPAISLLINSLHLILIRVFNQLEELVLNLFTWSTVVLQIILLMTLTRLISIIS